MNTELHVNGAHLDDQLWYLLMVAEQGVLQRERAGFQSHAERKMDSLLRLGIYDPYQEDQPLNAATRAIRYSAAITETFYDMFLDERQKVCRDIWSFILMLD